MISCKTSIVVAKNGGSTCISQVTGQCLHHESGLKSWLRDDCQGLGFRVLGFRV